MKYIDIKSKTKDELEKKFVELKKELYNINLLRANGELKNSAKIKQVKNDIARILTFFNEKKVS
ncbi:MAG: 50S ribosomal protein L29 [Alphaproteobacteria bacterium]|jgi:large subunit ribosomal protein L29|nr:50S ribosomal protein L29 [Alphaproteobacteria bacterium]